MEATDEERDPPRDEEPDDDDSDRPSALQQAADDEAQRLQRGSTVSMLGAEVPTRVLGALGIFLLVFMLVYAALWALGGGLGLALGWIPAAAAGLVAIRLAGRSLWA